MKTKEELKLYHAEWRKNNKSKWRAYGNNWYAQNKEARKISMNEWANRNPEKRKAQMQAWRDANKEHIAKKNSLRQRKLKELVVEAYGGFCVCCAENNIAFLTIDHINRDGKQHRSSGLNVYFDLIKRGFPKRDYRLLCMNCNWAMRLNNVCPHAIEVKKILNLEVVA